MAPPKSPKRAASPARRSCVNGGVNKLFHPIFARPPLNRKNGHAPQPPQRAHATRPERVLHTYRVHPLPPVFCVCAPPIQCCGRFAITFGRQPLPRLGGAKHGAPRPRACTHTRNPPRRVSSVCSCVCAPPPSRGGPPCVGARQRLFSRDPTPKRRRKQRAPVPPPPSPTPHPHPSLQKQQGPQVAQGARGGGGERGGARRGAHVGAAGRRLVWRGQ